MGKAVIQHYTAERRREVLQEGTVNQFRFPFDAQSSIVTKIEPCDPLTEPMYLEPPGITPFLVFCDESLNQRSLKLPDEQKADMMLDSNAHSPFNLDWKPTKQLIEQ